MRYRASLLEGLLINEGQARYTYVADVKTFQDCYSTLPVWQHLDITEEQRLEPCLSQCDCRSRPHAWFLAGAMPLASPVEA